jgi:mercuric ion binding protein
MMKTLVVWAVCSMCTASAFAAPQTVTLSVPGMNCAACPITIKKALAKVDGVTETRVNLDKREVRVTFDDGKASVAALTNATKLAGYPSTLIGANN